MTKEIAQRQQTRLARLARRAAFPFLKTIDDFDFTYQSTVRLALLGAALSPDFVTEGRALILLGKPGRGKTHLAVAIAYRAIQNGFTARFVTAAKLIDELSHSFRTGGWPTPYPPTPTLTCSSSMKSATSPTGRTRPTCCSMSSSMSGIGVAAR